MTCQCRLLIECFIGVNDLQFFAKQLNGLWSEGGLRCHGGPACVRLVLNKLNRRHADNLIMA